MASSVRIQSVAFHFPEQSVATATLIQKEQPHRVFSLRERRRIGVKAVRIAKADEMPSALATLAAQKALEKCQLRGDQLDMVVTATCTPPDVDMWSIPAKIARNLGADRAECFGVGDAACASALAALRVLLPVMQVPGGPERVLLAVGCVTPGGHFFAPATVYGDGAGAMVLQRNGAQGLRIVRADFYTNHAYVDSFGPVAGLARLRECGQLQPEDWTVRMKNTGESMEIMTAPGERGAYYIMQSLQKAGWKTTDLRWVVSDNAAAIIPIEIAETLHIPEERVLLGNVMRYGHAWVADLFVNLATIMDEHPLLPGERVACAALGQGEHWGVLLLEA